MVNLTSFDLYSLGWRLRLRQFCIGSLYCEARKVERRPYHAASGPFVLLALRRSLKRRRYLHCQASQRGLAQCCSCTLRCSASCHPSFLSFAPQYIHCSCVYVRHFHYAVRLTTLVISTPGGRRAVSDQRNRGQQRTCAYQSCCS